MQEIKDSLTVQLCTGQSIGTPHRTETGIFGVWEWNLETDEIVLDKHMSNLWEIPTNSKKKYYEIVDSIFHPDDIDKIRNVRGLLEKGNKKCTYSYRVCLKDGSVRYLQAISHLYSINSKGKVVYLSGITFDITSQEKTKQKLVKTVNKLEHLLKEKEVLQEELKKIKNRYTFATESCAIGVWEWNVIQDQVFCDPMVKRLFGNPKLELNLEGFLQSVHQDDREHAKHSVEQAVASKKELDYTFRIYWPDSSIHYIYARAKPQLNEQGELETMTGICYDITKSQETVKKLKDTLLEKQQLQDNLAIRLKEHEKNYAMAVKGGAIGVWNWDTVSNILTWNHKMHLLFDLSEHDFGHSYDDFIQRIHLEDKEKVNAAFEISTAQISAFEYNYRVCWRDGSIRYIQASAEHKLDENGRLIGMNGVCYDITDREQARMELEKSFKEAEVLQSKLLNHSKMLEKALEGISQLDANGNYIFVNEACEKINGYKQHELIELSWKKNLHPEDLPRLEATYNLMKKNGSAMIDARGIRKDGGVYYFQMRLIACYNESGKFSGSYSILQDITEQKNSRKKLEQLALYDSVTGLPNRRHLLNKLEEIRAAIAPPFDLFAVLFLDLDNFKTVNDMVGHQQGDAYLVEIAKRFKDTLQINTFLARLGGDEFVVIADKLKSADDAQKIAIELNQKSKEPIHIQGYEFETSVTIGIALSNNEVLESGELLRRADLAMYQAKLTTPGSVCVYSNKIKEQHQKATILEHNLRHAIKRNELSMVFQPLINLLARNVFGFEALLRWKNDEVGVVSPNVFIPIAEKIGFIEELGYWVINEVFSQARKMIDMNYITPDSFKISINCSSLQLSGVSIVNSFKESLAYYNLPGTLFILEITETVMMDDEEGTLNQLNGLVDCGVEIALDDFGRGYSSISYLMKLPVTYLKIDQSLIKEINNAKKSNQAVKAIIDLANAMELKVIAEGIEKQHQYEFLLKNKCEFGQGNLIKRPLIATDFYKYVSSEEQYQE